MPILCKRHILSADETAIPEQEDGSTVTIDAYECGAIAFLDSESIAPHRVLNVELNGKRRLQVVGVEHINGTVRLVIPTEMDEAVQIIAGTQLLLRDDML